MRYVVTGGGGFVGKALCRSLRGQGHEVVSLSRGTYPELSALGVTCERVDLGDEVGKWCSHLNGADGVFHTAAMVSMWGLRRDFYRVNVGGAHNLLEACRRAGVSRLVFTSSPSVVHTGGDLCGVTEKQPIPDHFEAFYPETKAIAEKAILAADASIDSGALRTVALRPHLIWGPGDTNLIPTILERARAGKLVRIGDGKNLVDLSYIDDCVQAHLLAMQALHESPDRVGGKAYFISQGEPVRLWSWIDQILVANGLPRVQRCVSMSTALTVARILEAPARALLLLGISRAPLLTRFLVSEMATSHYFDISRARNDFGYAPSHSIAEALAVTYPKAA